MEILMGQGRKAIELIVDSDSFEENMIDDFTFEDKSFGPGAVVGSARLNDQLTTIIANDAMEMNEKFPVVYAGIIGLEEAYKMSLAVYRSIEADKDKKAEDKRPLLLIVDTPGNGPGKQEEIFGMNKATGSYQLALAEARKAGHPIVAMVIGRAISGAFLCHGLQADRIISLSSKFETMIHVMPLTSVSIITKLDIERLEDLSTTNPVFAAGPDFFYQLGGVESLVEEIDAMRTTILSNIEDIRMLKSENKYDMLGPWGRGNLGEERGGRTMRGKVMEMMDEQFAAVAERYLS